MSAAEDYVYDEAFVDGLIFGEKTCQTCGAVLPATQRYWTPNDTNADGFMSVCKTCRNGRIREQYAADPEKKKARHRKYAAAKRGAA